MVMGTKLSKLFKFNMSTFLELGKAAVKPNFLFKSIHTSPILCLDFDISSGFMLASGDSSGHLAIWSLYNGELIAKKKKSHDKGVTCLMVLGGFHIITAGFDKMIRLFKLEKSFNNQDSSNSIDSVSYKTNSASLWKRMFSKKSRKLSARLTLVKEFRGHKGEIYCMQMVCQKTLFATGSTDNLINVIEFYKLMYCRYMISRAENAKDH